MLWKQTFQIKGMGKAKPPLEILTEADNWELQRLTLSVSLFSITISSVSAPVSSSRKGLVEGGGTSGFFCWKRGSSLENSQFCALWHTATSTFWFPEPFKALPSNLPSPSRGDQILAPSPSSSSFCPVWQFHPPKPHSKVCGLHWDNPQQQPLSYNKPQTAAPTACPSLCTHQTAIYNGEYEKLAFILGMKQGKWQPECHSL